MTEKATGHQIPAARIQFLREDRTRGAEHIFHLAAVSNVNYAMNEVAANQTYNLEGLRRVTVLEVAEGIRAAIGEHVKIDFVPERPGDFGGKEVSANKAYRELSWKPAMRFEEGLRITVDWFRQKWENELPAMKR